MLVKVMITLVTFATLIGLRGYLHERRIPAPPLRPTLARA
jgi:hypothetical protein